MADEKVKVMRILIEKAPSPLVSSIKASHSPSLETIEEEEEEDEEFNQNLLPFSNSSSLLQLLI